MNKGCIIEVIPAKEVKELSEKVKFYLISLVPEGRLTREKDIEAYLSEMYNGKNIEFQRNFMNTDWNYWCKFIDNVPRHRVVSTYGYVEDQTKMDRILAEGFEIEMQNSQNRGPKVKKYKELLFDFKKEANVSLETIEKINDEKDFDFPVV